MAKKKKRDSEYLRGRLQRDFPEHYDDVLAGRTTVNRAAIKAGLIKSRTRPGILKSQWTHASNAEQRDFLVWLKSRLKHATKAAPAPSLRPSALVDGDGHLLPGVVNRLRCSLGVRQMSVADLSEELGLSRLDPRTKGVLERRNRLPPEMVGPLENWLTDNAHLVASFR